MVASLLGLGLAEVGVRVAVPEEPNIRFTQRQEVAEQHQNSTLVMQDDDALFWRLIPSTRLPDESFPMRGVISNAAGLREDHEVAHTPPAGQRRVLFLGDSRTFGTGLLHDEGIVEETELLLRERLGDVEAINAGVPGYTVYQQWQWLVREGLEYDPDVVVVTSDWNEGVAWGSQGDADQHRGQPIVGLRWSRFARLVWQQTTKADGPERPRVTPDEFSQLLGEIAALSPAFRAVVWPSPQNIDPAVDPQTRTPYQVRVYKSGAAIDLIPTARELAVDHPPDAIFLDHIHATALASAAYAQVLADEIEPLLAAQ